jgi:hypothetical protein
MPPPVVRKREPVSRRLCAIVTVLAFAGSGCAVHAWHPVPEPSLSSLEGKTVRALCRSGDVELTVTGYSPPYLTGTCRASSSPQAPCSDPVRVDLSECARVDVQRLDKGRTAAATLAIVVAVPVAVFGTLALIYVLTCASSGCD